MHLLRQGELILLRAKGGVPHTGNSKVCYSCYFHSVFLYDINFILISRTWGNTISDKVTYPNMRNKELLGILLLESMLYIPQFLLAVYRW